jgi:hypothetical protein
MIKFNFLGHACVSISSGDYSLIIDPWFGTPFHAGRLLSYPPIPTPVGKMLNPSGIHISHIHQDHFCRKSLELFSRETPIFIGSYPELKFTQAIRDLGFKQVIEIPPSGLCCGPFKLYCVPCEPFDRSYDSLLILEVEGQKILLNNDCVLSRDSYQKLRHIHGRIDVGFLGYSKVSPYPSCYTIPGADPSQMLMWTQHHAVKHVLELDEIFQFHAIVPYANGIRVLESDRSLFNQSFTRLDRLTEMLPAEMTRRLVLVEPGKEWNQVQEIPQLNLQYNYSSEVISDWFKSHPPDQIYNFANSELQSDSFYVEFFSKYFQRVLLGDRLKLEPLVRLLDDSGIPLRAFQYNRGKMFSIDPENVQADSLMIDYPTKWINEVALGRITIGSLYYAFQFAAKYRYSPVLRHHLVHLWL